VCRLRAPQADTAVRSRTVVRHRVLTQSGVAEQVVADPVVAPLHSIGPDALAGSIPLTRSKLGFYTNPSGLNRGAG
jgi:hypothetical protein